LKSLPLKRKEIEMGWLLVFLILFVHPVQAADIQMGGNQKEVQVQDWRLEIICPKCGYVFYKCDVGEIFENDTEQFISKHCKPANSTVPMIEVGAQPVCPLDNTQPFTNDVRNSVIGSNGKTSAFFTNKGWLPRRQRPRWEA